LHHEQLEIPAFSIGFIHFGIPPGSGLDAFGRVLATISLGGTGAYLSRAAGGTGEYRSMPLGADFQVATRSSWVRCVLLRYSFGREGQRGNSCTSAYGSGSGWRPE
jgi:hypothetical protein